MTKQRKEEGEDRISQLPQPLLHHILCYGLSQKQAVQTCVLSKSWRHLGPTRPEIEFREEECFTGKNNKNEKFLSVLDTTLQRYQDQKLSVEDFWLEMSEQVDYSLLEKWVPIVMVNMGVKTFRLSILPKTSSPMTYFDLPSQVFRAQLRLQNLYLERCKLSTINVSINVVFRHLERLHLKRVNISGETFEKIMSCCPSIEDVLLDGCVGLKTIKVTADKLKRFDFTDFEGGCDIKMVHVQTIESIINMWGCPFWFQQHCHNNFLHLKVLCLWQMRLSTESFGTFSHNFPCLEDLTLHWCSGFEEIKLSSCSIERLTLSPRESITKVTIHAPNILYFRYNGYFLPPSTFSFTTASGRHGWKSDLWLGYGCIKESSCLLKLNQVLRALSQSHVSLELSFCGFSDHDTKGTNKGDFPSVERVAVEHLVLRGDEWFTNNTCSSISSFFTLLFRVCRPKNIEPRGVCAIRGEEDKVELASLLWKFLLKWNCVTIAEMNAYFD